VKRPNEDEGVACRVGGKRTRTGGRARTGGDTAVVKARRQHEPDDLEARRQAQSRALESKAQANPKTPTAGKEQYPSSNDRHQERRGKHRSGGEG